MKFMKEWFHHEEEIRTIIFKTVVGENIIPFSPPHDSNDRKKCAYNEQRHSRHQENYQMLKSLERIFREF